MQNETVYIEPVSTDEHSKYLLHGARQIQQILQGLIDARALISVRISPGGHSFLTSVVTFSDTDLFLDASPDESTSRLIPAATRLVCAGQLDKIRIQFSLGNATLTSCDGSPAYASPIPTELLRLQRREFYRLRTPISSPLTCTITLPSPGGEKQGGASLEARVTDISGGGIAIIIPENDSHFSAGAEFNDCRLALPELGPISIRLKIRNIFRQTGQNGVETLRAGCEFLDLPRNADNAIQRYIFKIERDRNARERGGL